MKPDAVERRHGAEVHVVGDVPAAEAPELLEQEGRRHHGGARVEDEPVLPVDVGSTAGGIELLEHGDAVAARAEANRGGEAAEAAANDDSVRARIRGSLAHMDSITIVLGLTNLL